MSSINPTTSPLTNKKYLVALIALTLVILCYVCVYIGMESKKITLEPKDTSPQFLEIQTMKELLDNTKIVDGAIVSIPQFIALKYEGYERDGSGELIRDPKTDYFYTEKKDICKCEIASSTYWEEITPYGTLKYIDFIIRNSDYTNKSQGGPTDNTYIWIEKDQISTDIVGDAKGLTFDDIRSYYTNNFKLNKSKNILTYTYEGYEYGGLGVYDLENNKDIGEEFKFSAATADGTATPNPLIISDDGKKFVYAARIYYDDIQAEKYQIVYVPELGIKKIVTEIKADENGSKDLNGNLKFPTVTNLSFDGDGISYKLKYEDETTKDFHIKI